MSTPVKTGPFFGINNKLPVEKLVAPADSQTQGAFVRDAVNVDLTAAGSFQRRGGYVRVLTARQASSLWSPDGITGYYVDGSDVKTFDGTNAVTVGTVRDQGATVSFTTTPLGVVWSDGSTVQLIAKTASRLLAPPPPSPAPTVSVSSTGSLVAGTYLVAFMQVYATGERSPLSYFQRVTVPESGAIVIAKTIGTLAVEVFVSNPNGTELYKRGVMAATDTTATLAAMSISFGEPVSSEVEGLMPAGAIVRFFRGRLLTVSGNVMYYSLPYNYGVTHPATHYIALESAITLCEPTQTGIYLATLENTYFLDGTDITTAELKPVAPYGAVQNTVVYEPNTLNMWWMTSRGLVRTTDSGDLDLKQDANISFSYATQGAGLLREENGLTQVISVLTNAVPNNGAAASSYMDAEVVN